jgi:pimeloyl-ACP methyl ester carboxylesterase
MPFAVVDGIRTRYEVIGNGPPLLMYSPAGFDATLDKWTTQGVYARIKLLEHLPKEYTCIVFDRRETGQSGGRVEKITWASYVAQGRGLLDHLKIERAHLLGGCMGCCPVAAFAVAHPERVMSMILYWPVGGAKYRISTHKRFSDHLAYVEQQGLAGVVGLVMKEGKPFNAEPRGGPWASVIRSDPAFADACARLDVARYKALVSETCRALFDRDTSPGAEPEDMLRCPVPALIVPGRDASHATSAARYLEECLPKSQYWDALPEAQTEQSAPARLLEFLESAR